MPPDALVGYWWALMRCVKRLRVFSWLAVGRVGRGSPCQGVGKVGSGGWLGDELGGAFWLS